MNAVTVSSLAMFCTHTQPKSETMNTLGSKSHSMPAIQSPIPAHQNVEISSCIYTILHYADQSQPGTPLKLLLACVVLTMYLLN